MPRKNTSKVVKKVVRKVAGKMAKKPLKTKASPPKKKAVKALRKVAPASPTARSRPAKPPAPAPQPVPAARPEVSLGRPLVTQEEKLYMLFHNDYQSRQVFEFLRVETVKELEEFSPQQIVHLMSRPIRLTVERIRQRLAEMKRSLKGDEEFAAQFRQARPSTSDNGR